MKITSGGRRVELIFHVLSGGEPAYFEIPAWFAADQQTPNFQIETLLFYY